MRWWPQEASLSCTKKQICSVDLEEDFEGTGSVDIPGNCNWDLQENGPRYSMLCIKSTVQPTLLLSAGPYRLFTTAGRVACQPAQTSELLALLDIEWCAAGLQHHCKRADNTTVQISSQFSGQWLNSVGEC